MFHFIAVPSNATPFKMQSNVTSDKWHLVILILNPFVELKLVLS